MKIDPENIAPIAGHCAVCGRELAEQPAGRRRVTCSPAHKQELYRRRRSRRRSGRASSPSLA